MVGVGDNAASHGKNDGRAARLRAWENRQLRSSLAMLSTLPAGQLVLEEALTCVASLALDAVPGADGAGLTLHEEDRPHTMVATAPFVSDVDKVQYGLGQGPCIVAVAAGGTVISPSLGSDERWPKFGSKVARMGVHSALSLPLLAPEGVLGSINIYARAKGAFDGRAAQLGESFAVPAAVAVQNAQVLAQTKRLAQQLQAALSSRAVIDRAIGIMLSCSGGTADDTMKRLRMLSQHGHRKVHQVAQSIVDEAIRRAETRDQG